MPLEEKTIVDIREEMALAVMAAGATVTEVAAQFGVSRPTVRLWRDRYRAEGRSGLEDRSHATKSCPHRTGQAIEELIVKERKRWGWGSKKLLERLREAHPSIEFPQRSTVDTILERRGLLAVRREKRRALGPRAVVARYEASEPSELTTIDYKGNFRLRDGRSCYPLTLVDSVSRYLLACEALPTTDFGHAWPVIERIFRKYGLPKAMQSDNGPPFGTGQGRFSTMSVVLMSLGVQPVFSRPGKPQDNARHERMHRDLKADIIRYRGSTLREQQRFFDRFRRTYNVERPHEGIGQDRPARRFRASLRPFPRKPRQPEYPQHWEKRKVMCNGVLRWHSQDIFLSETFDGRTVAFEPIDNDLWRVRFYEFIVGTFDEKRRNIT
jgi:transposase InsO family protein